MNTPTLETERLILRKLTENDLESMYQIYSDEEVNKFLPWFPLRSFEEARLIFPGEICVKICTATGLCLCCLPKKDNFPLGYINVDMEKHHDFGYGLRKEFWNQGIMTEAGKAVVLQM